MFGEQRIEHQLHPVFNCEPHFYLGMVVMKVGELGREDRLQDEKGAADSQ